VRTTSSHLRAPTYRLGSLRFLPPHPAWSITLASGDDVHSCANCCSPCSATPPRCLAGRRHTCNTNGSSADGMRAAYFCGIIKMLSNRHFPKVCVAVYFLSFAFTTASAAAFTLPRQPTLPFQPRSPAPHCLSCGPSSWAYSISHYQTSHVSPEACAPLGWLHSLEVHYQTFPMNSLLFAFLRAVVYASNAAISHCP